MNLLTFVICQHVDMGHIITHGMWPPGVSELFAILCFYITIIVRAWMCDYEFWQDD